MQSRRRGTLAVRRPLVWLGATAAFVFAADQLTKAAIRQMPGLNEPVVVIPGFLDITRIENTGAAFGLMPGRRWLFIAISLFLLAAVAVYWRRERPKVWPVVIALGLVVGGALGNLVDRALVGKVTDFLAFSIFSPVFNIADSAIVVGAAVLALWVLFGPQGQEDDAGEAADADDDGDAGGAAVTLPDGSVSGETLS